MFTVIWELTKSLHGISIYFYTKGNGNIFSKWKLLTKFV